MSVRFNQTLGQMNKEIIGLFLKEIGKDFNKSISIIQKSLPGLIANIVRSAPEYTSLVGGDLKYELGIPDAATKIDQMIRVWSSNITYKISPPTDVKGKIKAKFSAEIFKADFSDILGTDYAQVYDQAGGYNLPWFQWLVLDGGVKLIPEHEVKYVSSSRSRTGGALMVRGAGWGIVQTYAGTIADNWITRSIRSNDSEILNLLTRVF